MMKPNSPLGKLLSGILDQFVLNLVYFVFCIPVFTIGAATTALYKVEYEIMEGENPTIISAFYQSFTGNFKQSSLTFLVLAGAGLFVGGSVMAAMTVGLYRYTITKIVVLLVVFLLLAVWGWVFPLISKFDRGTADTLRNAYILSFQSLPTSFVIIVVNVFIPALFFSVPQSLMGVYLFWMMFFHASAAAFINTRMIWRALKKYMQEENKGENHG